MSRRFVHSKKLATVQTTLMPNGSISFARTSVLKMAYSLVLTCTNEVLITNTLTLTKVGRAVRRKRAELPAREEGGNTYFKPSVVVALE